ncbi:MAG: hypothetical protein R3Y49_05405 [Rikenellaceae bacterium]
MYSARITQDNRALIVLLLDRSGSMKDSYGGEVQNPQVVVSKAHAVAEACNLLLMDIVARCRLDAHYRHYFDICVMGYSSGEVYSLLCDNRWFLSPTELVASIKSTKSTVRNVLNANGSEVTLYNNIKTWIEPHSEGDTPICAAFTKLYELLCQWHNSRGEANYFPPTIINITDGEISDQEYAKLKKLRDKIMTLGSKDGNPLLFNFHISSNKENSLFFPTSVDEIPDEARNLYNLSSVLPPLFKSEIARLKCDTEIEAKDYRAFCYNSVLSDFMRAMYIGTATTQQINQ